MIGRDRWGTKIEKMILQRVALRWDEATSFSQNYTGGARIVASH